MIHTDAIVLPIVSINPDITYGFRHLEGLMLVPSGGPTNEFKRIGFLECHFPGPTYDSKEEQYVTITLSDGRLGIRLSLLHLHILRYSQISLTNFCNGAPAYDQFKKPPHKLLLKSSQSQHLPYIYIAILSSHLQVVFNDARSTFPHKVASPSGDRCTGDMAWLRSD